MRSGSQMFTRIVIFLSTSFIIVGCEVVDTTREAELEQLTPLPRPIEYPKY